MVDGKIAYWRTYTEQDQALRDIGLDDRAASAAGIDPRPPLT